MTNTCPLDVALKKNNRSSDEFDSTTSDEGGRMPNDRHRTNRNGRQVHGSLLGNA